MIFFKISCFFNNSKKKFEKRVLNLSINLKNLYSSLVIQIDEIDMNNQLKYVSLSKSNIKCDISSFPIQIVYYISENSLDITISSLNSYDRIAYLIPEMIKILKTI